MSDIKKYTKKPCYKIFRKLARKMGYDIILLPREKLGIDPYLDMKKFVQNDYPVLFDVGANYGQTIDKFKDVFCNYQIHAFEPSPIVCKFLISKASKMENLNVWNYGIGSSTKTQIFNENIHQNMSSFLEIGEEGWGKIENTTKVSMTSIDEFCLEKKVKNIDVLKIDTQGYELEVLKGATKMMTENKIGLLFFEVNFIELYKNLPTFGQLYDFAINHGFELITIYPIAYRNKRAGWTDVLLKHKSYKQELNQL